MEYREKPIALAQANPYVVIRRYGLSNNAAADCDMDVVLNAVGVLVHVSSGYGCHVSDLMRGAFVLLRRTLARCRTLPGMHVHSQASRE